MSIKRRDSKGRVLRDGEIQKADGRYEFRYNDIDGKRRSLYSWKLTSSDALPDGKRPCEDLRSLEKAVLRDVQDGIRTQTKTTLDGLFEIYISGKAKIRGSTRTSYRYMYNKYIKPELGSAHIECFKYSNLKSFFERLGLSSNSIKAVYSILHSVFELAVRDNYIRKNPLDGLLKEMNLETTKKHGLTPEQEKAFMEFLDGSDVFRHWKPLFTCMLGTGCRIGEMLGLRWSNVDWQGGLIFIDHTLSYRLQESGKVEFCEEPPKTKAGVRQIPMMQSVRKAILEERMRHPDSEFIFVNRYGKPLTVYDVNRAIERIVGYLPGVPKFTSHQLRHTFATKLCQNETDLKLIQEIMGHADISTTMNIYNESNIERKKASFARLESTTDFTTNNYEVM